MVIAAALKAGAHFTVSKQTKRNSKWTMACGIVDRLITSLVLLSSGFHGSPVRTESLDGGWDLEAWEQGLGPCLTPTFFCSPFTQHQGSLDKLQGSPCSLRVAFAFLG